MPALTADVLALIARDLIRRGESVFAIEVERGELALRTAGSWDTRGPWRESEWRYRLDLFGPSGNVTRFLPADSVVHVRYATDPARPWHGLSPLAWARATGTLAANLEQRLGEEAGGSVARLIPVPADGGAGGDGDPLAALKADIAAGRGKALLVETVASAWGDRQRPDGLLPVRAEVRLRQVADHPHASLVLDRLRCPGRFALDQLRSRHAEPAGDLIGLGRPSGALRFQVLNRRRPLGRSRGRRERRQAKVRHSHIRCLRGDGSASPSISAGSHPSGRSDGLSKTARKCACVKVRTPSASAKSD
ncbi:MAG: hypothetical protein OXI75_04560 [Rhodospirillales bacterium]|nr:hypothetical protein [Rhodospirillales bacterium]